MLIAPMSYDGRFVPSLAAAGHSPAPGSYQPYEDETQDLRGLFDVLRRRAAAVLGVAGAIVALALAWTMAATPLFTANVMLLLDPRDPRILQTEVTPAGAGSDVALVESQLRIVLSDAVLGRVVSDLGLGGVEEFSGRAAAAAGLRRDPGPSARTPSEEAALETLRRRVTASRADRTYVLEIKATSADPQLARRIADAVAAAYLVEQSEAGRRTTLAANAALNENLDDLREDVRRAEAAVAEFRAANGLVGEKGTLVTDQQIAELNQRLIAARAEAAAARARYQEVRRGDAASTTAALASPVVGNLRAQIAELTRKEAELSTTLGPAHPSVVQVRNQLANARRLVGEETGRIVFAAKADADAAQAAVDALEAQVDRLSGSLVSADASLIRLRELEREAAAARGIYEASLTRAKQTGEQARLDAVAARVIAPAATPTAPSFPSRTLVLLAAAVVGLGLGAALALLMEHFDERVRTPEHLRSAARLPVLAVIPPASRRKGTRIGGLDPSDYAFRALHNDLRDGAALAAGRSATIVGSTAADGGTVVALSLALTAVAAGDRVLIVDADPARRALTKLVAPDAAVGLHDVLDGKVPLVAALVGGRRSQLQALPCGPARPGQRRRATRADYERLYEMAKRHFDFVVFDAPPALDDPDARAVADAAGQVFLVARAGKATRGGLRRALAALRVAPGKMRGAVLTMASATRA